MRIYPEQEMSSWSTSKLPGLMECTAPTCGLVSGEGVTTQTMLRRRTNPSLTGIVQYGIAEYSRQLTENIPNWVNYPQLVV